MSWTNVKTIFHREVRDQLRDRRTLFMIAVLPILLYPLMGMVVLQVSQFRREHPTRVWLIGAENLPADPQLLDDGKFAAAVCPVDEADRIELTVEREIPARVAELGPRAAAQELIAAKTYDAVVYIPPQFAAELDKFRSGLESLPESTKPPSEHKPPQPEILANTADDMSRVAYERVDRILGRWRTAVVMKNLKAHNVPPEATSPFEVVNTDIAEETTKRAAIWSKILPFVLLIWSLTGAFYPAIDLCAGEKERGTLETLLSSPAQRSEIVWGKLLTVMTFSMATSLLNLASMAGTGGFVIMQMQKMNMGGFSVDIGPPPLAPMAWLLVALLPVSALFSALSLAIAAFARSSKEGQYYLMPLLLITLPLMIFPIMPATQLELGTAIIPVAGMMLLLRTLMEGQYWDALRYALPVVGVTLGCCLLAVRWAVDQFNNESVLFRESERLDLRLWLRHLVRDRGETPTIGEAILCGVLILLAQFFLSFAAPAPANFAGFATITLVMQIAVIATPPLLMAIMLTSRPRKTLLLQMPAWHALPLAVLLAALLHPVVIWLSRGIHALYPVAEDTAQKLAGIELLVQDQPLAYILLLMAVTPAICEELAFRGFILSGLRHIGHRWVAVAISSFFFGITHGMLQQSLSAMCVGLVIGYLAIRTGSLLPGVLFHLTNNALVLSMSVWIPALLRSAPWLEPWLSFDGKMPHYHPALAVLCGLIAATLLYWLSRQPYRASDEERLQQALDQQTPLTHAGRWSSRMW